MQNRTKSVYICGSCGFESAKWYGKCPGCGAWNTLEEELRAEEVAAKKARRVDQRPQADNEAPIGVNEISFTGEERLKTGLSELDRVFGGGIVKGSVTLIGGDPGIGKSTLLLQMCEYLKTSKILYVSGEESLSQLKLRSVRLGVKSDNLFFATVTDIDKILSAIDKASPEIVIIDSIQTLYSSDISSIPGSISQIKETALRLTDIAKGAGITVFIVGHINKEGAIAGPKVLEHMVDAVLYFEGDKNLSCRILRAAKNRFGSTNEIGLFDMRSEGLSEILNPSSMLLSGRPQGVSGTCVTAVMEGTRPILAEIQALLVQTAFGMPRRTATGLDQNRVAMLLAVLEKRAGLKVSTCDVFINVVGGLRLSEPSCDLAAALAMASAFLNRTIDPALAAIGEIGLAGEIRAVPYIEERIFEAQRLGFEKFIVSNHAKIKNTPPGVTIMPAGNIARAVELAL